MANSLPFITLLFFPFLVRPDYSLSVYFYHSSSSVPIISYEVLTMTSELSSKLCLVIHYGRNPADIYNFIKQLSGSQDCLMQDRRNKELVVARRAASADSLDIFRVRHKDIASIQCVFDNVFDKILIQEYLELSLHQLRPLTEVELASSISQV